MSIKTYPGPKDDLWGVAWGSVAPDGMATTSQAGITTEVDVTSCSVTWNAVAGRKYLLSFTAPVRNSVAGNQSIVKITDSSNVAIIQGAVVAGAAATTDTLSAMVTVTGLATGSVTYKLRAVAAAGTVTISAAATNPCMLMVQDVGPA